MSLINKMLQELDKRHAAQAGAGAAAPASAQIAQSIRSVKDARFGSDLFWWLMAGGMGIAIAWLLWVMWQLTPHPVVNEIVLRSSTRATLAAVSPPDMQPAHATPAPATPAAAEGAATEAPATVAQEPRPGPVEIAPPVAAVTPKLDMLKLATEITTPIPVRPARAAVRASMRGIDRDTAGGESSPVAPARPGSLSSPMAGAGKAASPASVAPPHTEQPAAPPRVPSAVAAASGNGRIDKRNSAPAVASARELAEADYRRAMGLVNQGRISEGMDGLRTALVADGSYDTARQTLVALLVEQRRMDDAVVVLQQGLDLNPANSNSAMLLARILVERQDLSGALALLQKHAPAASGNADYHAFAGALYQRLSRHREAIDAYQTALRLSPQSGIWWVGLGISQEASDRKKEAADAFRHARSAGNLGADLLAYVDQRLRQLQ